uniref:Uncharacterized protein n=1 Tax=Nelumbo nucifera TaxID=4432 RepID=A0A822Z7D1_NELNU|nr:TPA_asm: hypothetical protein HUJ06_013632 [Nelumbo nucifera]
MQNSNFSHDVLFILEDVFDIADGLDVSFFYIKRNCNSFLTF